MRRGILSLFIGTVLCLQAVAAFNLTPGPIDPVPFLYPFLDYPMYRDIHHVGDTVHRYRMVGVTADSGAFRIGPEELGIDYWLFFRGPLAALRHRDTAKLRDFMELVQRRHGRFPVRVRLLDAPWLLRETGADPLGEGQVHELELRGP